MQWYQDKFCANAFDEDRYFQITFYTGSEIICDVTVSCQLGMFSLNHNDYGLDQVKSSCEEINLKLKDFLKSFKNEKIEIANKEIERLRGEYETKVNEQRKIILSEEIESRRNLLNFLGQRIIDPDEDEF